MPYRVLRPRFLMMLTYLLLGAAGASFLFWEPSQGLKVLMGDVQFIVWNTFLMGGALIGIVGAFTKVFRVEIIALPFLGTGLAVYGLVLLPRLEASTSAGTIMGVALVFFAAVTGLIGRGWELIRAILISNKLRRRAHE